MRPSVARYPHCAVWGGPLPPLEISEVSKYSRTSLSLSRKRAQYRQEPTKEAPSAGEHLNVRPDDHSREVRVLTETAALIPEPPTMTSQGSAKHDP